MEDNDLVKMFFKSKEKNLIEDYFDDNKITNFKLGDSNYPLPLYLAKNLNEVKKALLFIDPKLYKLNELLLNIHAEMFLEELVKTKLETIRNNKLKQLNRNVRYSA